MCLFLLIGISSLCESILSSLSFLTLCSSSFTSLNSPHFHLQIYFACQLYVPVSVCVCLCGCVQGPGRHTLVPWHRFYHHVGPAVSLHFLSVIAKRASGLAPHDPKWNKPCSTRRAQRSHTHREAVTHFSKLSPKTDVTSVIDSGKRRYNNTSIDILSAEYHRRHWIIEANNTWVSFVTAISCWTLK